MTLSHRGALFPLYGLRAELSLSEPVTPKALQGSILLVLAGNMWVALLTVAENSGTTR